MKIEKINEKEEISLTQVVEYLKFFYELFLLNKKFIVFSFLCFSILGFTYAYIDKPLYKAELTFSLEEEKSGSVGSLGGLASSLGIDIGGGASSVFASSNITEFMKSKLILKKTLLNKINNDGDYVNLLDYYVKINNLAEFSNIDFNSNKQVDTLINKIFNKILSENIKIYQKEKKVSIYTIETKSIDENFSKLLCENIANEVSKFYIESKSRKARLNVQILQTQVDSVRKELNNSINGVAVATDNAYNLNPSLIIKSTLSRKRQIDVQANSTILTQLVAQLELSKINLRKETPLIQIIDNPTIPLQIEKLSKIQTSIIFGFFSILISICYLIGVIVLKKK
jgi:uncharacterized protein involved in exopolysaccharide biosynthesis